MERVNDWLPDPVPAAPRVTRSQPPTFCRLKERHRSSTRGTGGLLISRAASSSPAPAPHHAAFCCAWAAEIKTTALPLREALPIMLSEVGWWFTPTMGSDCDSSPASGLVAYLFLWAMPVVLFTKFADVASGCAAAWDANLARVMAITMSPASVFREGARRSREPAPKLCRNATTTTCWGWIDPLPTRISRRLIAASP